MTSTEMGRPLIGSIGMNFGSPSLLLGGRSRNGHSAQATNARKHKMIASITMFSAYPGPLGPKPQ